MNEQAKGSRQPPPPDSPLVAARANHVDSIPLASPRPLVREMERPRTESYGELWQRASMRMRRF